MPKSSFFLVASVTLGLTACSDLNLSSRGLIDAGAAATGGGLTRKLGGNTTETIAAGAGSGLAADLVQGALHSKNDKKVQASYDLGRSDATKQLYWASQRLQSPGGNGKDKFSEYQVNLPEQNVDGVIFNSTNKTLRINE